YLWLLSRTPTVERGILDKFIEMSKERGFDTNRLIYFKALTVLNSDTIRTRGGAAW
ncbi:hypothetical protein EL315_17690, partial [Vibrio cholerae]|uniref:lipocalin family protein n=1 Tax=Vibrio cholerae TaxID=666 RepID=UPI0010266659